MIHVYSQVFLQFLLIVVDVLFVVVAYVLCNLLSTFNNPATQMAAIMSSVVSFAMMWFMELSRSRARKRNKDHLLDELPWVSDENITSEQPAEEPDEFRDTAYDNMNPENMRRATNRLSVSVTIIFVFILALARYGPKALQLMLSDMASPEPELLISNLSEASRNNTAYRVFQSDSKLPSKTNYYDLNADYTVTDHAEDSVQTSLLQSVDKFYNPWFLRGAEIYNYTFRNGTTIECGIGDQWIDTVLQSGPLPHSSLSPIVPFIPRLMCQALADEIYNYSPTVFFWVEQNITSSNVFKSNGLYSDFVGYPKDNYSSFIVDIQSSKVFATTLVYNNSDYHSLSLLPLNSSLPRGIRASNIAQYVSLYNTDITDPNIWVMVNEDTETYIYTPYRSITTGINQLIKVFDNQITSACLAFTVMLNSSSTSRWSYYNRIIMCYREPIDELTISEVRYSARTLIYNISKESKIQPQPSLRVTSYTNGSMMYFLPARILPIVANIKVSPFLYGAFQRATGYTVEKNSTTMYLHEGRLRYNVTPIIFTIAIASSFCVIVHFFCKVILHKWPQGIPSYYGLLHEYHQYRDSCTLPLSFIIAPAYEGTGYDETANRNHIGLLSTGAYQRGPMPNARYGGTPRQAVGQRAKSS